MGRNDTSGILYFGDPVRDGGFVLHSGEALTGDFGLSWQCGCHADVEVFPEAAGAAGAFDQRRGCPVGVREADSEVLEPLFGFPDERGRNGGELPLVTEVFCGPYPLGEVEGGTARHPVGKHCAVG
ncbi:hypothetical protein ACFYXF_12890 [Streptomyces sp. NPDC002680]|uniref:hypothetical protein n=1 Tax=Streptomyces sp. NPDC002680 TaxID=3364659 RepID=UPI0036C20436